MLAPVNYCFLYQELFFLFVCLQPVKKLHSAPLSQYVVWIQDSLDPVCSDVKRMLANRSSPETPSCVKTDKREQSRERTVP